VADESGEGHDRQSPLLVLVLHAHFQSLPLAQTSSIQLDQISASRIGAGLSFLSFIAVQDVSEVLDRRISSLVLRICCMMTVIK